MELERVKGNTWVLKSWELIPLYQVDDTRCILLDTGTVDQRAELEAALEAMTEAEYDPAVIDAYLDALDRKAPMPDHTDAGTAYAGFQARVQRAAGQVSGRRAARGGCVRLCPGRRPGGAGQSNRQEGCPGRISRNI